MDKCKVHVFGIYMTLHGWDGKHLKLISDKLMKAKYTYYQHSTNQYLQTGSLQAKALRHSKVPEADARANTPIMTYTTYE